MVEAQNSKKTAPGVPFERGKSGNPGGRPKMPTELKEAFQKLGPEALKTLTDVMRNSEQDAVRVKAAEVILDRGYGKATQPIEGNLGLEVINIGMPAFARPNDQG